MSGAASERVAESVEAMPTNYYRHGYYRGLTYAHTARTILIWAFAMPVALMGTSIRQSLPGLLSWECYPLVPQNTPFHTARYSSRHKQTCKSWSREREIQLLPFASGRHEPLKAKSNLKACNSNRLHPLRP